MHTLVVVLMIPIHPNKIVKRKVHNGDNAKQKLLTI